MTPAQRFFMTLRDNSEQRVRARQIENAKRDAFCAAMRELFRQNAITDPLEKKQVGQCRAEHLANVRILNVSRDHRLHIEVIARECKIPRDELIAIHALIFG